MILDGNIVFLVSTDHKKKYEVEVWLHVFLTNFVPRLPDHLRKSLINLQERSSQLLRGGRLKQRKNNCVWLVSNTVQWVLQPTNVML